MAAIAAGRFIKRRRHPVRRHRRRYAAAAVAKAHPRAQGGRLLRDRRHRPGAHRAAAGSADPRVMDEASMNSGPDRVRSRSSRTARLHTIAFLGAAQVDRFGNLNSTLHWRLHRSYRSLQRLRRRLRRRLSGQCLHRLHAARQAEVRREAGLPHHAGLADGGTSRQDAGFTRGGPLAVVTDLCVSTRALLRRRRPRVSWCRCRKARAGGVPTGPSVGPAPQLRRTVLAGAFAFKEPRQTRERGRRWQSTTGSTAS